MGLLESHALVFVRVKILTFGSPILPTSKKTKLTLKVVVVGVKKRLYVQYEAIR